VTWWVCQARETAIKKNKEQEMHKDKEILERKAELFEGEMDHDRIVESVTTILESVGEDPQREGLVRTPLRVANAYQELLSGYRTDPIDLLNEAIFDVTYDEMVIVRDIEFYSMCIFGASSCCLFAQRKGDRAFKASPHRRYVCSTFASSGTYDQANCGIG
jgi:hypothetical protein